MKYGQVACTLREEPIVFEVGRLARQAKGAIVARCGESIVLSAVVATDDKTSSDFIPLTVDYREKAFAAGKFPGGFFKREGRPTERETLTSRLIDRPVRPLFHKQVRNEIQIVCFVFSADGVHDTDILAMNATSAALHVSDIPWDGPLGAVRIGRVRGQWMLNPTFAERQAADVEIVVAGSRDGIIMVEGGATELAEKDLVEALELAHAGVVKVIAAQETLRAEVGKPKTVWELAAKVPDTCTAKVDELLGRRLGDALLVSDKHRRQDTIRALRSGLLAELAAQGVAEDALKEYADGFEEVLRRDARRMALDHGIRIGGRLTREVRPLDIEVGVLPRVHGSALFTRGQTQSLAAVTLGTSDDEQVIDDLGAETVKRFMLHYNFPPFCVGEVKFLRGPGRREIGHGALAERAIKPVIPSQEVFPYAIRVVSEILESDGSSSMASVCSGSLALMDAGVPIKAAVAGVAMGLVKEGSKVAILTDILGAEDHLGDMDFKVAGTRNGVTAIQMDIKVGGVTADIMKVALEQAREARLHILDRMDEVMAGPRAKLSPYAPRIETLHVDPDRIRDIIGPGGKTIRQITAETGAKIDVEDDGTVHVASSDEAKLKAALSWIQRLTESPEVGKTYLGKVRRVESYGAFVEILPGTDGLLHISQIAEYRVKSVRDEIREGDEVLVKLIAIDPQGRLKLSRKAVLSNSDEPQHAMLADG
ncbi:MAG: polyribonucleotide nucleotidyltransferase [Candidatus Schekmanbacteria bacterium]|nr:polyribonucleotide nucleotidyltransferase [Candidatus Schekmanbacteria bacterium]